MSSLSFPVLVAALSWKNSFSGFVNSQHDYATYWLSIWALCILAYLSNPSPLSFRTHLTSLSFHSHLRRLSSSARPKSTANAVTAKSSKDSTYSVPFSNRIHLSFKTPPYHLKSYGLFTLVVMPAPSKSAPKIKPAQAPEGFLRTLPDQPAVWIGAFGRWWSLTGEQNIETEDKDRLKRLAHGVHDMHAVTETINDDHTEVKTTEGQSDAVDAQNSTTAQPGSVAARVNRNAKRVFKAGQRRSSPTSISRLRNKATSQSNAASTAESTDEPAKTHDESKVAFVPDSNDEAISEIDANLEAAAQSKDPVIVELRTQVDELRSSTIDNERRLQEELDLLRKRKREEDQFRSELKAKTRELEEQKRNVELSKNEAERELGDRRAVLKERTERVNKLRKEVQAIERKEQEVVEKREKKKRDRKEREKKLREDVNKKRDELRQVQGSVESIGTKVSALEQTVIARRELLQARRNEYFARYMGGAPGVSPYMLAAQRVGSNLAVPYSQGSRPGSVRSFEPAFSSAPSSPVLGGQHHTSDIPSYDVPRLPSGALAPNSFRAPHHESFYEHRLHHTAHSDFAPPVSSAGFSSNALPSVDDIPEQFLPFDSDKHVSEEHLAHKKPVLSLPLQYLDSGLLASSDSPAVERPLSPMTPSQASLIPSQLFHMLDEDEADEEFVAPDSPTLAHSIDAGLSKSDSRRSGLGLDATDLSSPSKIITTSTAPVAPPLLSPVSDHSSTSGRTATEGTSSPWELAHDPLSRAKSPASLVGVTHHHSTLVHASSHGHLSAAAGTEDDMPRSGLSLNPDAKAFAFAPRPSPTFAPAQHISTGPSNALGFGSKAPSSHSTFAAQQQAPSTHQDDMGIPRKSRMDFAKSVLVPSSSAAASSSGLLTSSSSFDWSRGASPTLSSQPHGAAPSTSSAPKSTSLFDPFGADDELLGPLKRV